MKKSVVLIPASSRNKYVKEKEEREAKARADAAAVAAIAAAFDQDDDGAASGITFVRGGVINPGAGGGGGGHAAVAGAGTPYRLQPQGATSTAQDGTGAWSQAPAAPAPVYEPGSKPKLREMERLLEELKSRKEGGGEGVPSSLGGSGGGPARSAGGPYDGDSHSTNLCVGNIPPTVTEEALERVFSRYGPITSTKIMWPRTEEERRRGKNTGFVNFARRDDAEAALAAMQDADMQGHRLFISWGKPVAPAPHPPPPPPLASLPPAAARVLTAVAGGVDAGSSSAGGRQPPPPTPSTTRSPLLGAGSGPGRTSRGDEAQRAGVAAAAWPPPLASSPPALWLPSSSTSTSAGALGPGSPATLPSHSSLATLAPSQDTMAQQPAVGDGVGRSFRQGAAGHVPIPPGAPVVTIHPPREVGVRRAIDLCAQYVVADGHALELLLVQQHDTDWGEEWVGMPWLVDASSEDGWYYRWRVYSLLQGDTLHHWRTEPFQMMAPTGSWIIPPPCTASGSGAGPEGWTGRGGEEVGVSEASRGQRNRSRSPLAGRRGDGDAPSPDRWRRDDVVPPHGLVSRVDDAHGDVDMVVRVVTREERLLQREGRGGGGGGVEGGREGDAPTGFRGKGKLFDDDVAQWSDMLRGLMLSRSSIEAATVFAYDRAPCATDIVECMKPFLCQPDAPATVMVARLYLASDLVHNAGSSVRNATSFRSALQSLLPTLFDNMGHRLRTTLGRLTGQAMKDRVFAVLASWERSSLFPPAYITGLESTFLRRPGEEDASAIDLVDESSLSVDDIARKCRQNGLPWHGSGKDMLKRLAWLNEYAKQKVASQGRDRAPPTMLTTMAGAEAPAAPEPGGQLSVATVTALPTRTEGGSSSDDHAATGGDGGIRGDAWHTVIDMPSDPAAIMEDEDVDGVPLDSIPAAMVAPGPSGGVEPLADHRPHIHDAPDSDDDVDGVPL